MSDEGDGRISRPLSRAIRRGNRIEKGASVDAIVDLQAELAARIRSLSIGESPPAEDRIFAGLAHEAIRVLNEEFAYIAVEYLAEYQFGQKSVPAEEGREAGEEFLKRIASGFRGRLNRARNEVEASEWRALLGLIGLRVHQEELIRADVRRLFASAYHRGLFESSEDLGDESARDDNESLPAPWLEFLRRRAKK